MLTADNYSKKMDRGVIDTRKIKKVKKWLGSGSINIFGIQFSGKDTQGRLLANTLDCPLIGGGDILRSSEIPDRAKEALKLGKYIDSQDYLNIMLPYFNRTELVNRPLILSSVGRWIGEEVSVIEALQSSGHQIKAVVYLKLDEDESYKRLDKSDRGRDDDHHENLRSRINEFKSKTLPVVEAYKKYCPVLEIDGSPAPEKVFSNLINSLYKIAT
jgi:adenylate kinase